MTLRRSFLILLTRNDQKWTNLMKKKIENGQIWSKKDREWTNLTEKRLKMDKSNQILKSSFNQNPMLKPDFKSSLFVIWIWTSGFNTGPLIAIAYTRFLPILINLKISLICTEKTYMKAISSKELLAFKKFILME